MSQHATPEEEKRRTLSPATPRTTTKTAPPVSSPHNSRQSSPAPANHPRDGSTSPTDKRRHASIAGIGVGVTQSYSPTRPTTATHGHTSPKTTTKTFPGGDLRRSSDSTSKDKHGEEFGKELKAGSTSPSIPHIVLPRRTGSLKSHERASGAILMNMDRAHKRLSDSSLTKPPGALASALRKNHSRERSGSGASGSSVGSARLETDEYEGGDGSDVVESSDEEGNDSSSDELDPADKISPRGRRVPNEHNVKPTAPAAGGALGLLAELEEEISLSAPYKPRGRTLLAPPETTGDKSGLRRKGVHPFTSFDSNSAFATPVGSDDEAELSDIKDAQNLSVHMSSIDHSIPNRAIRTIIRGDFPRLQQEANEGLHRQRKYLVATDLSDESVYALEWTIGTILRDGDTLFAFNAIDEETKDPDLFTPPQPGEGARMIRDTTNVVGQQTERTALRTQGGTSSLIPHALSAYFGGSSSRSNSVDSRARSNGESERKRAVEAITQTCVRLLRKTKLQVRVAVEVIHCKSPKHLITEAIDELGPTLVILGSRGRSNLKGVLLGSFSNYLVMKSSVPVMVARKKLKKHSKKANIRLSNNLRTPRSLAMAKID